jgi:hypothetical protein
MAGNPHGYWVSRITLNSQLCNYFTYKYFLAGPECVIGQGGQDYPTIVDGGCCVIRKWGCCVIGGSLGKMWSYLCMLGGMGYAGGPIESLGGWGDGGVPSPNFTFTPIPRYSDLNATQ